MKPSFPAIAGTIVLLNLGSARADTIAYWRFEGDGVTTPTAGTQIEDSNGRTTTATGVGIRAIDSSGNGNTIWAWEHAWAGHTYDPAVPWSAVPLTGAANGFFAKNSGDYPALFTWSTQSTPSGTNLDTWTSSTWTIEASFYTTALGQYRTVVGREGNGVSTANANAAPLYFQMQNNNRFRIAYVDASGVERSVQDGSLTLATNVWYHYAATCDGATLKLYRKGPDDSEFVLAGSLDVSGSANSALIDPGNDINGDPWGWTIGRGRYGVDDNPSQNHGDRWFGGIDEVRISDVALEPSEFLATPDLTTDADNDGLPDAWELEHELDPNDDGTIGETSPGAKDGPNGALGDPDNDTYDNLAEYNAGSDPQVAESIPGDIDGDELPDSWEETHFETLAYDAFDDPDGDYGDNLFEYEDGTDPDDRLSTLDVDDGTPDGMGDYWEEWFFGDTSRDGTDDFDVDDVSDLAEWTGNSDPTDPDDPYPGIAAVTWSAPVTVTSDSDILTAGTLVHAGNFRSDNINVDVTVGAETISFANRQSQAAAGDLLAGEEARVIAGSGGRQVNAALFDATGTTVSTTFESVLDGSAWETGGSEDMILRVTGPAGAPLVVGQEYQIQLFYSDDRPTSATRAQRYHDGLGHATDVFLASASVSVVGTFLAPAEGYMDIYIQNTSGEANFPKGINAYVLRTVSAGNDSDSDGMDDTWETTYGLSVGTDDSADDLDGDGTDNLTEYRLGLTPNDGSSRFAAVSSDTTPGDGYTITWQGKAGLDFTVERSATLEAASWTNLTPTPQAGVDGTNTFTDPAPVPAGKAFYRVILEP